MNRNSLFGLLGITLLTFLGAFILGRWTRPVRSQNAGLPAVAAGSAFTAESLNSTDSESNRQLAALRTEAYQEEGPEEEPALRASMPLTKLSTASKSRLKDITTAFPLATATRPPQAGPAKSTATAQLPATAPAGATVPVADSTLATESIVPRTVIAKDVIAIEERQNYAAQLPDELRQKGVEATINVVGELADVIIMSSTAFDARSKDTLIKEVCIDLKTLGFKRVHITDGAEYSMHFGL